MHGDDVQAAVQLPDEQAHVPDEHELGMRDDAVPGSATAGPPFGVLLDVLLLEPLHAAKLEAMPARTKEETRRIPGPAVRTVYTGTGMPD